ncbi:hypothetical protein ANCCEY_12145 [Ancylostoma ceylanicum]|uniref:G-protein alpha subunit n=1 Tax=Ancylostoma ceylanicum TaxID=53326 RepID=A0A0D6LBZ3_9BILA|nr:hypothetical protein ANCCEY_12145 [Ancylostoma ceylanicum]
MLLCCSGGKDEHTKTIERELHNERKILRRQVKILLLGSGESGKSTFIKQMNIIHGAGEFTADEVRAYRQQIYQCAEVHRILRCYPLFAHKCDL